MPTDMPIDDPWSGLNHKSIMDSSMDGIPRWVPRSERRRLTAYQVLAAYLSNNAREFLAPLEDDPEREHAWQEFGDPALIIARIADAVVGENPQVAVIGADSPLSDGPDLPDLPVKPDETVMEPTEFEFRSQLYTAQLELWEDRATAAFERWQDDVSRQPGLIARQDWLRQWAEREGLIRKVVESEQRNIVPLGSGIYVHGWDEDRERPTIEIFDPASYFPVLDDTRPSEFPNRLHLAWGFTEEDRDGDVEMVRRVTYELVRIDELPEDFQYEQAGYLAPGDDQTHVCLLSDGVWKLEAFKDTSLDDIERGARWRTVTVDGEEVELRRFPIGYDFIPVVHVTHDLAAATHFGTSPVASLAQLFDELQASDTDTSMASRWAARPPFTVSGMAQATGRTEADKARNNLIDVSPGKAMKVAAGGGVDIIDMAKNLTAIEERVRALLRRVSVNGSVSEGLIGRVDASEVPSGFALTLSFTSFEQMIHGARLARESPYRLIPKMVQRIQLHHGEDFGDEDKSTEVYPAEMVFGAFMPQDLSGTIEVVARAVLASIMSIETAVNMLEDAGVPVADIAAEVASIRSTMGEVAEAITNATGDPGAGASFLGLRAEGLDDGDEETAPAGTPVGVQ